jgi:hypothetical protein
VKESDRRQQAKLWEPAYLLLPELQQRFDNRDKRYPRGSPQNNKIEAS